jgi:hypothetical protein
MKGECDHCRSTELEVKESGGDFGSKNGKLCDLCRSTLAGNAFHYAHYGEEVRVLSSIICFIGNRILKRLDTVREKG